MLQIDEGAPVRLASTNQAWIYERPSASPIVTSYGRWKRFDDQATALSWLRTRPAGDAGVVPVVGDVSEPAAIGTPAQVIESHIDDESVTARVAGATPSLVSAGQVVGDGWKVTVDGKASEMVLIDGGIMAAVAPPGAHRVDFRYAPRTVRTGALLSGGAVLVAGAGLLALAIFRVRRFRLQPTRRPDVSAGAVTQVLERSPDT
jgi:Bacterial membrane protein YfhO